MADPLALYRAVMGTVWEDDAKRTAAARDAAGARQGRGRGGRPGQSRGWTGGQGNARWGQPCARNLMRAATGGQAAVFKRIRAGGCKSPRALRDQLSYVNDKAVFVTSTLLEPEEGAVLSPQETMEIVDAFTARWRGETKLGHTSHMLLSFPLDVPTDAVREAREAGLGAVAEPAAQAPAEIEPALDAAPQRAAERAREQAEQGAYLAAHPELLASPDAVYAIHPDGTAELREGGQAPRVMGEVAQMGIAGTEADAEARIAAGLTERHPDMPGHVARDLAITYAQTAKLVALEEGREASAERGLGEGLAAPEAVPAPELDLQALAVRLRDGYLAEEEKPEVARALEAALRRHLGDEGMRRLDEGEHEALVGVLPSVRDRMNIARERLDLRRELGRERGLERDMDDDMGL